VTVHAFAVRISYCTFTKSYNPSCDPISGSAIMRREITAKMADRQGSMPGTDVLSTIITYVHILSAELAESMPAILADGC